MNHDLFWKILLQANKSVINLQMKPKSNFQVVNDRLDVFYWKHIISIKSVKKLDEVLKIILTLYHGQALKYVENYKRNIWLTKEKKKSNQQNL